MMIQLPYAKLLVVATAAVIASGTSNANAALRTAAASRATTESAERIVASDTTRWSAVLDSARAMLARRYVDGDTGKLIGDVLRKQQLARAYDSIASPARFAELVTRDLRTVNGDLHLSLRYDPPVSSLTPVSGAPPAARPFGSEGPAASRARRENYGIARVEILPGNVGYLEVTAFQPGAGSDDAIAAALNFLRNTDATIIDVRRNGGGASGMSHLLFSHFLKAEPVPTVVVWSRTQTEPRRLLSNTQVPGPRRPDVPLYILTSRYTASAAEEFSFVLKNQNRAKIVGDRTAGAGHMVNFFDVGNGFVLGASITRVTDPKSGKEWEAVGVQPDIAVSTDRALEAAQSDALKQIAKSATDPEQLTQLALLSETADARLRNARPTNTQIAQRAGLYDGGRTISARDGRLYYSRDNGPVEELIALPDDRFALGGTTRVSFDGSNALVMQRPGSARLSYRRM